MANDPDALFPSGPTTRRGLLSAFSRRAAERLPDLPNLEGGSPAGRLAPRPPKDYFHEEPPDWIDPVLSGDDLVAEIKDSTADRGMHIWWLGQSGFLVQIAGESVVLDPYLSDSLSPERLRITGLVAQPEQLAFVDAVVSSHSHADHLDPGTLPGVLSGAASFVCAAGIEDLAGERAGGRSPDASLAPGEAEGDLRRVP